MAIVHPEENVVSVYINEDRNVVISQATPDDPFRFVVVDACDIGDLIGALESAQLQIKENPCPDA